MPLTDSTGLPLTLDRPQAVQDWDNTVAAFLRHDATTPDHLASTLHQAPAFALGWAVRGLMMLLLGRAELVAAAHESAAKARAGAAAQGLSARERPYLDALDAWLAGRPRQSAALLAGVLETYPEDTLALKLDQAIRFTLGDRRGMARSARIGLAAHGRDHVFQGYALGCMAFALEENGEYVEAETHGRLGLEIAQDDAWGLHAVAHVYDMTAQDSTGIDWLEQREHSWAHCNNFGYHVWWHLALFHLDRGAYDRVLDLYDTRVRREHTDDYRDVANAASMLTRLEIEGVDVGERWQELAGFAEGRVEDGALIFADLHYLLALGGAENTEAAEALMARIARDAQRSDHDMHEVAAVAGHPAALGLAAFRAGHYDLAYDRLRGVRGQLGRIGGSHAQRDVFSRLMIEAALRAGRCAEAEVEIRARAARRGAEDGFTHRRLEALSRLRGASVAAQ
ncbi:MAG: tetratricopeptide repeat protein [Pseudomonadota bacterium]